MYYGIVSALFSFAYSNPPLSAIINISSLFVVYLISYYHNGKLAPMEFIGKYSLVLFSFVLFNSWWLLNLFNIVDDALKIYSVPFATAWLEQTVAYTASPIAKSLSLTHITPAAEWDFLGAHYHSFPAQIITLLPLILVTYIIFFINDKSHAKFNLHLLAVVLLMIFLTKGNSRPFGEVYVFLFKNIPFFNIFKTPVEKFGLLYVVFFTMLILFVFHSIKEHPFYKKILTLFSTYLLFCAIPIFTGNIIPDQRIYVDGTASRIYKDKPEYQNLRNSINKDPLVYRVLSLPGMGNYQMLIKTGEKTYYTGIDPILFNSHKPILEAHNTQVKPIFFDLLNESSNVYSLLNVGKLVVNPELIPWFGRIGEVDAETLKKFYKNQSKEIFGNITVYNNFDNFLPKIYAAPSISIVN